MLLDEMRCDVIYRTTEGGIVVATDESKATDQPSQELPVIKDWSVDTRKQASEEEVRQAIECLYARCKQSYGIGSKPPIGLVRELSTMLVGGVPEFVVEYT
jgi:hypothetical protein